ncbi:hypothetical protein AWV79_23920 [Cupriavidus sp. UYMMa02A]|nr:hypothetical protein AWV79_23920 [Cupriavidus sp. UYMMa02A]
MVAEVQTASEEHDVRMACAANSGDGRIHGGFATCEPVNEGSEQEQVPVGQWKSGRFVHAEILFGSEHEPGQTVRSR